MARPLRAAEGVSAEISRNLALELVRVTEAGALASARWMGRGDKNKSDGAAVDAMRRALGMIPMDGVVVIGEGEKDEAPMLFIGERIGNGNGPEVDIAVDPIDGTTLTSKGLPGAISVVALAERGSMFTTHVHYMQKLVVGRKARGVIDLEMPVEWNLKRIAKAEGLPVQELTVVSRDGVQRIERPFNPKEEPDSYQLMVESFGESIQHDRPVAVPLSESIANMKVLDAIREAAKK